VAAAAPGEVAGVEDGDESCTVLLQGRKEAVLQRSGSEDDGSGLAWLDEEWGARAARAGAEGVARPALPLDLGYRRRQLGMARAAPARWWQRPEGTAGSSDSEGGARNDVRKG
jgi:hypothetical protein